MEEKIGKRINRERTDEAIGLDPDMISTACPFCMVMLSDAVTEKKADGSAKDHVQVLDVAEILQQSLRPLPPPGPLGPPDEAPQPDPAPDPEPAPAG
jgi:hypothetical protein